MPIMPTRVNRVPRLGQPAPVSTGDQPVPLASGEIDGHDKLSRIMRAMANGNLAEAKQFSGLGQPAPLAASGQPASVSAATATGGQLRDMARDHIKRLQAGEPLTIHGNGNTANGTAANGSVSSIPRQQMYRQDGGMAPGAFIYLPGSTPPMKQPDGSNVGDGRYRVNPFPGRTGYQAVIDAQAEHNAGLPRMASGGLAPFTTNFNHPGYADHVASEQAAQDAREQFRRSQPPTAQFRVPQFNAQSQPSLGRPANGYNTPNMNTYVKPGGGFAAGFGPEHGIDSMVAANRLQQQRNGYGAWERGQLRLGGAKPEPDLVQSQAAPTLPTTSQFSVPRGYNEVNGGTAVQNGGGSRLIGSALMQQFTNAGHSAADLVPGSPNYANAKRSLDALTSQAENARIAAQTAAGGGLSRAGQYDQRQKDIKALRYDKQRPTSLAFREAMGRVTEKQNQADFTRQLQQKALAAHLATMTPQQQMQYLAAGSGATPAAPIQTQQQPEFNFGLGGSNLPGPAHGWPDMSPMLPAAPPPTMLDTPPRRSAMPDYGQPVMPGRRWGGF